MITLQDLYAKKEKFENDKKIIDARIFVVNEMIAEEEAKEVVESEVEAVAETCEDVIGDSI